MKNEHSEFLELNLTCWIRIRISKTDPDGDLNTDPPRSGTLERICNFYLEGNALIPYLFWEGRINSEERKN